MYMNRFIVGMIMGIAISVGFVWYACTTDKDKCCMVKKSKKWAKRVSNIY